MWGLAQADHTSTYSLHRGPVQLLMIAAKNRRGQREGSPENGILPGKKTAKHPRALVLPFLDVPAVQMARNLARIACLISLVMAELEFAKPLAGCG